MRDGSWCRVVFYELGSVVMEAAGIDGVERYCVSKMIRYESEKMIHDFLLEYACGIDRMYAYVLQWRFVERECIAVVDDFYYGVGIDDIKGRTRLWFQIPELIIDLLAHAKESEWEEAVIHGGV